MISHYFLLFQSIYAMSKTKQKQQMMSMSQPITPDPSMDAHKADIDRFMKEPLRSQAEKDAEIAAQVQKREQLISNFDNSEDGRKLHQYRFEKFVVPMMTRLLREMSIPITNDQFIAAMQNATPWVCRIVGDLTETEHINSQEYKAWEQYYDQYLDKYAQQYGG